MGDNNHVKVMYTLTAVLHKEEDMYVAECPEVGTVSQGHTIEDAVHNLKEATEYTWRNFQSLKNEDRLSPRLRWFPLPKHRGVSGEKVVKILCNTFGFSVSGHSGSHVRLSRIEGGTKIRDCSPSAR